MTGKCHDVDFGETGKDCYLWLVTARIRLFFLDNDTFANLSPAGVALFDAAITGRRGGADGVWHAAALTVGEGRH